MHGDAGAYAILLVRKDIDRFDHNLLFSRELIAAFAAAGVEVRALDYIKQTRPLLAALRDEQCRFFLCFNGFGSELVFPSSAPGRLRSAYAVFKKRLFDIMHDCPAHESMAHQIPSTFAQRTLLITDYGYAAIASQLGVANVLFVPSISFPASLASVPQWRDRSIEVLLPVSLVPPSLASARYPDEGTYKSKIYGALFQEASAMAIGDWNLDPATELAKAAGALGLALDWRQPDHQFLLTTTLDYVKFSRRDRLVRALQHLPVTVLTDRETEFHTGASNLRFVDSRSATEMLALMAQSRMVVAPTPHMTGFHERSLGALTAGAALLSSPNRVLETDLVHGRDVLFWASEAEAVAAVERLLADPALAQTLAENGRARVGDLYPPARLVRTVMSFLARDEALPGAVQRSAAELSS